ncbi:MAG: 50S ribosomal protein L5 [Lentisphaerae bacterium]|nr:50S ribosomal protein L5 [Lentisphaerota bacterium]
MATLKEKYRSEVVQKLQEQLGIANRLRVPRLTKVVVNMGMGIRDKDVIKRLTDELTTIAGQKPVQTKARKSISNFKLREGMVIGAMVTLRGDRMYEFLDRLINAAIPRIRDFRGLSTRGFDSRGNYTLGIKDQTIFPELDPDQIKEAQGMDITIVTTARDRAEALALLRALGMPFAEN